VSEQTDERQEVEESLDADLAPDTEAADEAEEAHEVADAGDADDADDADDAGDAGEDSDDDSDEDAGEDSAEDADPPARVDQLEAEGDIAADYLEELLDIADLDGDLDMDVEGDRAAVSIVGAELSQLVGSDGEVLEALQELTRLAVYRETGERSRLMLDISGYRADKRAQLEQLAEETATRVKESGEPAPLDPMTPFERKVVHDAVAAAGLSSESEGVEPRRFVVVLPAP
jgi:spoIIIJ-associated protein